ncbi:hypothetical protein CRUP_013590 [Coryphaenoides rupestris]|nr:hypothetical protein CRUP_013590 [Coryphaenoides rupestris]
MSYAVSPSEINGGNLTSQIEFFTQEQPAKEQSYVRARTGSFQACVFSPATWYSVRLRHRYRASSAPWSLWSPPCSGRTAEDAPSEAPAFWRRVIQTDKRGWRNVSLMWKPLRPSEARGRVLFHNVSCSGWRGGPALEDLGTCGEVPRATTSSSSTTTTTSTTDSTTSSTSCLLLLPPGSFSCSITATNSVGTSPVARVWLLSDPEADGPPPNQITVTPLDDHSLDVRWTAPVDQSVNGFVVEWSVVTSDGGSVLHWERLSASQEEFVITEGVEPHARYAVRVTAVYAHGGTGRARAFFAYTRQGAPSAGPKVVVQDILANRLELAWRPVPEEQQRGYIRNYTVYYTHALGPTRSQSLPAQVHWCSLGNLLPGYYNIYMLATTDAGPGVAGPATTVNIAYEDLSAVVFMVSYLGLPLLLIAMLVPLLGLLAHQAL